jgi:ParB-like chromosome segregation protein Spo0J
VGGGSFLRVVLLVLGGCVCQPIHHAGHGSQHDGKKTQAHLLLVSFVVMKIELWPIDRPRPYQRNARKISAQAVDKVALSLKSFGWRQPIVVDPATEEIIAGHARHLAAQQLNLAHVPVHLAHDLTADQIKAYRLMDNRSHETLWDAQLLGEELEELQGLDLDLSLTGFDDFEIDGLLDVETPQLQQAETVKLADLTPHPRNYRKHTKEQLEQIIESVKRNGVYRQVVVAEDNTILAGHGLIEALHEMGRKKVQVHRLPIDSLSPQALKVLVGDNDIAQAARIDQRTLAGVLSDIEQAESLLGTGHDEQSLRDLQYLTSGAPKDQLDRDAEWAGMPEFTSENKMGVRQLIVHFETHEDVENFGQLIGQEIGKDKWIWFPKKENPDMAAFKYVTDEPAEPEAA